MPEFGAGVTPPTYVTSLPSSAYDGQEIYYAADATNGVIWHLRYRAGSGSSYKWEYLGGPPLQAEVVTEENAGSALTTYQALTTAGPSITTPLAGDYDVEIGSFNYTPGSNKFGYHSYDIGGTGAVDADAIQFRGTSTGNTPVVSGSRLRRKTALSASTALVSKYRSDAGTTGSGWGNRWMRVTPVRVG